MKYHKVKAEEYLEILRTDSGPSYKSIIGEIREAALCGGFSLADIGTSEEELEQLRLRGCEIAAKWWLSDLRKGSEHYRPITGYLHREVLEGGLSLADIGTSNEELEQLRIIGCLTAAKKWLGYLRIGTNDVNSHIKHLRMEVLNGNLSLADIGTSEEELEQLRRKGCRRVQD